MKLNRAYSLLTIKSVDSVKRIISGIATTPTPDRMGDIVESTGAEFALPIPLLWQHDSAQPVGNVIAAKVGPDGISVTCQFISNTGSPTLDARLDEAFAAVQSGLVRGLSIGFMPKETADIEGSWSQRFTRWEWLELSAVTIPANSEATIQTIKSIDRATRGVSGRVVRLASTEGKITMNIAARILALTETRVTKAAAAAAILEASDGRTTTPEEKTSFEEISAEVAAIDEDLALFAAAERMSAASAVAVERNIPAGDEGSAARVPAVARTVEEVAPGIRFARSVHVRALCMLEMRNGNPVDALALARRMYPHDAATQAVVKSTVDSASSGDSSWAGSLIGAESTVYADFAAFLRPQTIIGQFGAGGIPGLLHIPFRVRLLNQSSAGSASWVGESKPAPLTRFAFGSQTLAPLKVVALSAASMELIRDSSPAADVLIRDELAKACAERMDKDFIDPNKAAVANVSPASITHGVVAVASSGPDGNSIRQDIGNLVDAYLAANMSLKSAVMITSQQIASKVSLMRNALGQREFPNITPLGGSIESYPVITSEFISGLASSNGQNVLMVSAGDIYFADDGETSVDMSVEASLEMSDAPGQDAAAGTGASMVSMFQTNSVAFRATRTVNWALRRPQAVQMLDDVAWGNSSS
jgi:HK97 family phage prohead protease